MAQLSIGELTAIGVGLGNIAAWSKLIYDARKNGKNGTGKACPFHSGIVSDIEKSEEQKIALTAELASLHKENRDDHQKIFDDIKGLSIAVAGAASASATAAATVAEVMNRKKRKP